MALKIRLTRRGAKKRPQYRIVVADSRFPRDGRFIEIVGTHNPLLPKEHESRVVLKEDRIKHWLSVGARPTDRVHRFLDAAGILKREPRLNPQKALPGKKRQEREEEAARAAEEAKAAAEAPAEEAPAEEAAAEETPAEAAAPAEEAAAETEAPAEEAPAEEAPAEEAKAEEAPAEEPAAEAPAEEAPAEEAPAEAEAGGEGEEKKEEAAS